MRRDMVAIETMLILTGFGDRFAKRSLLQQPDTHTHRGPVCMYLRVIIYPQMYY